MKIKLIALALASVVGAVSNTVMAEEAYQGSMYLMPTLGYVHPDGDLEADNDVAYGLRIGKEISQHWDVQLGLTHSNSDADNRINGLVANGDYKQTLFGVDALYMFSRDKFRPFLLAGLGGARNDIDYTVGAVRNVGNSNTSWMANVGAGFQYFFTDTIGMQADVRHVWSRAEDKTRTLFNKDSYETIGNTLFNIGVIFNFGAPKQTVAAAEPVVAPSNLDEIAPTDDEALPELSDPSMQPEPIGPDAPAFAKMTLSAEVLFGFDKDGLKDEGKKILDVEVIEKMKAHPEVELVLITGHTDLIGDDKYNQKLSERRANQVKKYIASQGVAASRLHAVGKGETQPVADCKGVRGKKLIECLQPNRRVVVEIEAQRQVAP